MTPLASSASSLHGTEGIRRERTTLRLIPDVVPCVVRPVCTPGQGFHSPRPHDIRDDVSDHFGHRERAEQDHDVHQVGKCQSFLFLLFMDMLIVDAGSVRLSWFRTGSRPGPTPATTGNPTRMVLLHTVPHHQVLRRGAYHVAVQLKNPGTALVRYAHH